MESAEAELAELTDAICDRDYSARRRRAELRLALGLSNASVAEVENEHMRRMKEAMDGRRN